MKHFKVLVTLVAAWIAIQSLTPACAALSAVSTPMVELRAELLAALPDPSIRPVINHNISTVVDVEMEIRQLIDVNEVGQKITLALSLTYVSEQLLSFRKDRRNLPQVSIKCSVYIHTYHQLQFNVGLHVCIYTHKVYLINFVRFTTCISLKALIFWNLALEEWVCDLEPIRVWWNSRGVHGSYKDMGTTFCCYYKVMKLPTVILICLDNKFHLIRFAIKSLNSMWKYNDTTTCTCISDFCPHFLIFTWSLHNPCGWKL